MTAPNRGTCIYACVRTSPREHRAVYWRNFSADAAITFVVKVRKNFFLERSLLLRTVIRTYYVIITLLDRSARYFEHRSEIFFN